MARYFDNIKVRQLDDEFKNEGYFSKLAVNDVPIPKDAVFGDVIQYGPYRATETVILGKNCSLIENSDLSSAGYLTIPLKITKHFKNAVKYYQSILDEEDNLSIVLRGSDQWVVKKYGEALPKGWRVIYWPDGDDDDHKIEIRFGRDKEYVFFNFWAPLFDIMKYHNAMDQPIVEYRLTVKTKGNHWREWYRYEQSADIELPVTWKCDELSSHMGEDFETYYRCYGPVGDEKEALEVIKAYHDGYRGEGMSYLLRKEKKKV